MLDYWIGLYKDDSGYKWLDGSSQSGTIGQWDRTFTSTNNEKCVKLIGTDSGRLMKWQPESCRKSYQGICEAKENSLKLHL